MQAALKAGAWAVVIWPSLALVDPLSVDVEHAALAAMRPGGQEDKLEQLS